MWCDPPIFVPTEILGGPRELAGWPSESHAPKLTAPVGMELENVVRTKEAEPGFEGQDGPRSDLEQALSR